MVLRGARADGDEARGGDDARLGRSTPLRIGAGGAKRGEKRERARADGEGEGDESVADLRARLAAVEADAAAAREETASWKKRHGELRAFVSEELVDRETER